ncbi:DNA/RNA helicase domain-containing protein [Paenibacillus sp. HW567]|uniref:DNA/RNA helicase domain-containing protein n=1 Tax=Paenibacillus sp. HW567 TaxID=1034769 RepID=UPI000366DDE7|nr:DNA/RNA helicase domain-containing protein [Paenibacillus sp. HW567]
MLKIETYDYIIKNFDEWEIPFDYHCVYILENGKEAYIGETNNSIRRAKEHSSNSRKNKNKKYLFNKMHIITGFSMEETPAKHYENLLIKLMKVDNKFHIVNRSDGQKPHYQRKNDFERHFDKLWLQLEEKGLVKTKEFNMIINSNTYKYSPHTALTEEQHKSLTSIVNTIDSGETLPHEQTFNTRPILIKGDAGTGKTVVATSLFHYLKSNERFRDKKIALVYANPSTRSEIQEVFKNTEGLNKKDVISPVDVTKQHYDIIICDEAQRLRRGKNLGMYYVHFKTGNARIGFDKTHDELDWILANSNCQILFYDGKQSTSPSDITHEHFEERLYERKRGIRPIELDEQLRIKAGNSYVPYIYDMLYQKTINKLVFENYDFKLFTSFADMVRALDEKEKNWGLCRLCSGYAWEWKGKEDNTLVDISIDGVNIKWNSQTGGWLSNLNAKKEMGSIYTLPGLDLNYAGVIIGPDLEFDKLENMIKINKNNFFDNKVKNGITDEELKSYILNTYAVFLTRGIRGTYVYVCDDNLREYLKKYIPVS